MSEWDLKRMPDLRGRTAIVTGANSGIGYPTALELGRSGASVVIACRDLTRGQEALQKLKSEIPGADFRLEKLDLASLNSISECASRFLGTGSPLDLLVNNAGLMVPPKRKTTDDGFEIQFGTNHLGHFALTGLLMPALRQSANARVVTVSSGAARWGKMAFNDLQSEKHYDAWGAYCQSKLANLLFMLELGNRNPWLVSVAAHPGGTQSNLQRYNIGSMIAMKLFGQSAASGALPTLRAAAEPVKSGAYFAPNSFFNLRGAPIKIELPAGAENANAQITLWDVSERLTKVNYDGSLATVGATGVL